MGIVGVVVIVGVVGYLVYSSHKRQVQVQQEQQAEVDRFMYQQYQNNGGDLRFEDWSSFSNRYELALQSGTGKNGRFTADDGALHEIITKIGNGDKSAEAELRIAKHLLNEGKDVHLVKASKSEKSPDFIVNGQKTDVKRTVGTADLAGDL